MPRVAVVVVFSENGLVAKADPPPSAFLTPALFGGERLKLEGELQLDSAPSSRRIWQLGRTSYVVHADGSMPPVTRRRRSTASLVKEITMRRSWSSTELVLIAALAIGCSDQSTQPAPNRSQVSPSETGRWGVLPPGATTTAKSRPNATAAAAAVSVAQFANGSFETGDYSGWTLFEGGLSTEPSAGTWGIAQNGQTIEPGQSVFDFFDGIDVQQSSPGLPHTYTATDGNFTALQLQNGPQTHRMYQDIAMPVGAATISWDMEYNNHNGDFVPDAQELAVYVRDVSSDEILATLFRTTQRVDPQFIPVTHFSGDVSAFAGRTVRISIDMIVDRLYFDAAFDNFKVDLRVASAQQDCKNGGWTTVFRADGSSFKSQGDCIQYVATGK
jgi:hypothetical protein